MMMMMMNTDDGQQHQHKQHGLVEREVTGV